MQGLETALNCEQIFITSHPVLTHSRIRDTMQELGQGGLSGATVTGAKPHVQKDLLPSSPSLPVDFGFTYAFQLLLQVF